MDEERFWALVDRSAGTDGCWPWLGPSRGPGHGPMRQADGSLLAEARTPVLASGSGRSARKLAYELAIGPVTAGSRVYVSCHDSLCVQPAHLMLAAIQPSSRLVRFAPRGNLARRSPLARSGLARSEGAATAKVAALEAAALAAEAREAVLDRQRAHPWRCIECRLAFGSGRERSIDERICHQCLMRDPSVSLLG